MDIFSFSLSFPRSQPAFAAKDIFDSPSTSEIVERLKEREERLESRKKALCFGGRSDDGEVREADANRTALSRGADDEDDDEDDMDAASASSYSVNEPSEIGDEEIDEEIPLDESEAEDYAVVYPEPEEIPLDGAVIDVVPSSAMEVSETIPEGVTLGDTDEELTSNTASFLL